MIANIISLLIISMGIEAIQDCPEICTKLACDSGILSCSKPGLVSMPLKLPKNTGMVLLMNQDFSKSSGLSYANISNYGLPDFKITKITIQNCQLVAIASETFSHLPILRTLDLSFNKLRVIEPRTFEDLNLNFLRLDGNLHLMFRCTSFTKSIIRQLSLKNCSITSIDFCVLKPIVGVLKRLILSHNFLKTIDQKFEFLFQRLDEIRLNENVFQCSGCQLKWLSQVLKTRFRKFNYSHFNEKNLAESFPKCVSPQYLSGNFIHRIIEDDFVCSPPAIRSIDVAIDRLEKLSLSCHSFSVNDKIVWVENPASKRIFKARTMIKIQRDERFHQYYCLVSNRKGNISTTVKVHWPPALSTNKAESDLSTETTNLSESSLYIPRFSLFELLTAIIVTFIIILIIFIICMKYSFSQPGSKPVHFPTAVNCTKNIRSNEMNQASLTTNYNYHDPENVRYDWSGNSSFGNSQTYDFPVSPGFVFLDFKTHEQIQKS